MNNPKSDGCNYNLDSLKLPQATPTLYGDDAIKFMKKVNKESREKVGFVPTPKLEFAVKKIREHVTKLNTTNVG